MKARIHYDLRRLSIERSSILSVISKVVSKSIIFKVVQLQINSLLRRVDILHEIISTPFTPQHRVFLSLALLCLSFQSLLIHESPEN